MSRDPLMDNLRAWIFSGGQCEIAKLGAGFRNIARPVLLQTTRPAKVVSLPHTIYGLDVWRNRGETIMGDPGGHAKNVLAFKISPDCLLVFFLPNDLFVRVVEHGELGLTLVAVSFVGFSRYRARPLGTAHAQQFFGRIGQQRDILKKEEIMIPSHR